MAFNDFNNQMANKETQVREMVIKRNKSSKTMEHLEKIKNTTLRRIYDQNQLYNNTVYYLWHSIEFLIESKLLETLVEKINSKIENDQRIGGEIVEKDNEMLADIANNVDKAKQIIKNVQESSPKPDPIPGETTHVTTSADAEESTTSSSVAENL